MHRGYHGYPRATARDAGRTTCESRLAINFMASCQGVTCREANAHGSVAISRWTPPFQAGTACGSMAGRLANTTFASLASGAALALLAGLFASCNRPEPTSPAPRENGVACGPAGDASCKSGHCDRGLCCAGGSCCSTPDDCPDTYRSAPSCTIIGPTTDCQGTRRDATCQDGTCGTVMVPDDSACDTLAHDCGTFLPVYCSSASDQATATCPVNCSGNADCQSGHACVNGACLAIAGLGEACSGTGQGSCGANLACGNGTCCASTSPCCSPTNAGAECAAGLGCDPVTFSCFTTCNDLDSSRCASAAAYCQGNACHPKLANGVACSRTEQCASGICECFDPYCSDKRCRSAWCGVCQSAQDGSSCGIALGSLSAPVADPTPGECAGTVACYAGICKKNNGAECNGNDECGYTCIARLCALVSGGGGPCDATDDCVSELVCDGGTCKAPLWASCSLTVPCVTGLPCCSANGAPPVCQDNIQRCK
jgi:hypothetical protein